MESHSESISSQAHEPPDAWMACMRRGDFAGAWRVSDEVLARRLAHKEDCRHWPRHLQFVWNGEPIDNRRVLIRCYHGLGDTLQFVRLIAPLRARAAETTLWVQPQLVELVRTVRGIDRIEALHDGVPRIDYDVDVELMEVPHILRLTPARIPRQVPYIYVPPPHLQLDPSTLNVGLAWRSGDWLPERSIPDSALAHLANIGDVRWYSLQYPILAPALPATNLACADMGELGSRMRALDLIISVDTMVAHLAGALGLPVWTTLQADCDWRWMSDRSDSPWYPTMRLLRQRTPGDWSSVIEEICLALDAATRRAVTSRARDIRSIGCRAS
ncbi:MAG TPA: hypothetical protein VF193_03225 [Steroidobacter sp.]